MARLRSIMQSKQVKKLYKNFNPTTLSISHMGSRGEGVSTLLTEINYIEKEYNFFIPFSLPNEKITVKPEHISSEGIRANILEIINASQKELNLNVNISLNVVDVFFNIGISNIIPNGSLKKLKCLLA